MIDNVTSFPQSLKPKVLPIKPEFQDLRHIEHSSSSNQETSEDKIYVNPKTRSEISHCPNLIVPNPQKRILDAAVIDSDESTEKRLKLIQTNQPFHPLSTNLINSIAIDLSFNSSRKAPPSSNLMKYSPIPISTQNLKSSKIPTSKNVYTQTLIQDSCNVSLGPINSTPHQTYLYTESSSLPSSQISSVIIQPSQTQTIREISQTPNICVSQNELTFLQSSFIPDSNSTKNVYHSESKLSSESLPKVFNPYTNDIISNLSQQSNQYFIPDINTTEIDAAHSVPSDKQSFNQPFNDLLDNEQLEYTAENPTIQSKRLPSLTLEEIVKEFNLEDYNQQDNEQPMMGNQSNSFNLDVNQTKMNEIVTTLYNKFNSGSGHNNPTTEYSLTVEESNFIMQLLSIILSFLNQQNITPQDSNTETQTENIRETSTSEECSDHEDINNVPIVKKRKPYTRWSQKQVKILKQMFQYTDNPDKNQMLKLTNEIICLNETFSSESESKLREYYEKKIKNWFATQRSKNKKNKLKN
jgi:Homeodomain